MKSHRRVQRTGLTLLLLLGSVSVYAQTTDPFTNAPTTQRAPT